MRTYQLNVEWLDRRSAIVNLLVDYRKVFDLIRHFIAVTSLRAMGARKHILLLVINFLQDRFQFFYSLFPGDTNSEWAELTCSAPQGTKLVGLLFLAVINFVLSEF